VRYKLGESSVCRILSYDYLERKRPKRTGLAFLLLDAQVNSIIKYCSKTWEHRILKYNLLRAKLDLKCSI
jgi:tRNA splicing ligase